MVAGCEIISRNGYAPLFEVRTFSAPAEHGRKDDYREGCPAPWVSSGIELLFQGKRIIHGAIKSPLLAKPIYDPSPVKPGVFEK
jgi:hypothetical protein